MASKAALAAALLLALVALSSASTFTTTVVTTSVDEESNPMHKQCRQQVQGRQFRACQRYLEQRGSPFAADEEEEEEEMSTEVRRQPYLQECCQQLKEMDRQQCGCEAIKHALKQTQQQEQEQEQGSRYQTGQTERIYQRARALPRMCRLSQQQCRFNVVFV